MSRIDEEIVRDYFERNGFLVRHLRQYPMQTRKKAGEENLNMLVLNLHFEADGRRPGFLLFSSELPYVQRAVVFMPGWHTSRFTPGLLKSSTKLLRFLEKNVVKRVAMPLAEEEEIEGMGSLLKVVVLPGFPTAEPYRSQAIELLRSRGVDGILSLRSMLLEIVARVEITRNYQSSGFLEAVRVLKNFDLIRDPQMELFED